MPRDQKQNSKLDFSTTVNCRVVLLAQLPRRGVDNDSATVEPRGGPRLAAPVVGLLLAPTLVVGHANG